MKKKKYVLELTDEGERAPAQARQGGHGCAVRMLNRARVLLKADVGEHAGEKADRRSPSARSPRC